MICGAFICPENLDQSFRVERQREGKRRFLRQADVKKGRMTMAKTMKTMDGNAAAAYASYLFTEVAGIFPITPSSPMAEQVDEWSANGKKNMFDQPVKVVGNQKQVRQEWFMVLWLQGR